MDRSAPVSVARWALMLLVALPLAPRPALGATTRPAATFDHFLFLRHDVDNGTARTDTVVLARITPGGFETRDIYTRNNLHIGYRPLCVSGGQLYAVKLGTLVRIDLKTGAAETLVDNLGAYDYRDGLFCAVARVEEQPRLFVYDLRRAQFREAAALTQFHGDAMAISPDLRRCAFFSPGKTDEDRSRAVLHVVDLASGEIRTPCPSIDHPPNFRSSFSFAMPPLAWRDNNTVVAPHRHQVAGAAPSTHLAGLNITTGAIDDLIALPPRAADIRQLLPGGEDRDWALLIATAHVSRFRIDWQARKVTASDTRDGLFRLRGGNLGSWGTSQTASRLAFGDRLLAAAPRNTLLRMVNICPDGQRAAWLEGNGNEMRLMYFDAADNEPRTVYEGWCADPFLWLSSDDLAPAVDPAPIATGKPAVMHAAPELGWRALQPLVAAPVPEPAADTRIDINDVLSFTMVCDKADYQLHEPVTLTFTLTNRGAEVLTLQSLRPERRSISLTLSGPRYARSLDRYWGSDRINPPSTTSLKPGQAIQERVVFEIATTGEHRFEAEFSGWRAAQQFKGRLRAQSVGFTIELGPDQTTLRGEKVRRIIASLREQYVRDPRWTGWLPAQNDLEEMGPEAGEMVLKAIDSESDAGFARRLIASLPRLRSPAALGWYREWALRGDAEQRRLGLQGMMQLYSRGDAEARELALGSLLLCLIDAEPDVALAAARRLREIHHPDVQEAFDKTLQRNAVPELQEQCARYLAAYDRIALSEWLDRAQAAPTQINYFAARAIVKDLERQWGERLGALPEEAWEQMLANPKSLAQYRTVLGAWRRWAGENPAADEDFFRLDWQYWPAKP